MRRIGQPRGRWRLRIYAVLGGLVALFRVFSIAGMVLTFMVTLAVVSSAGEYVNSSLLGNALVRSWTAVFPLCDSGLPGAPETALAA